MPSIADTYVTILPETRRIAAGVEAAFQQIGDQKVTVIADVDTSKAKAQLDEAAKERKAPVKADADTAKAKEELDKTARDRTTKIKVDVDRGSLDRFDSLMSGGNLAAAGALNKVLQTRQSLMRGGFKDILDYNSALLAAKDAESAFSSALSAGASGMSQFTSGLGEAVKSGPILAVAIIGVSAALVELAGVAAAASGALLLIPAAVAGLGGVVGTLMTGLDGVKEAWDAAGKAAQSSGKDQTEQAKAVQSAQLGLKTATEDEARAQRDVATARKDATKELRDLNSELRHGALDEKGAELNLQQDIFDLQHGTFQNSIDFQKQQLRVLQDQQDLADAKTRNNDLSQKANTLRAQGVEGNPKVVDAEQRLADSIQKVAVAQQTLTSAFKPSADALAQAQAFAKLSTNAQTLLNTLLGMKPAFQELKFAVQDALFANLGPQLQQLVTTYLPMVKQFMTGLAQTMNQTFGQLVTLLQTPAMQQSISNMLTNLGRAFAAFAPSIGPLVSAFAKIAEVGSGFLPGIADGFARAAEGFNNFIQKAAASGQLQQWIQTAMNVFGQLGPLLVKLAEDFIKLAPLGEKIMPALVRTFEALGNTLPAIAAIAPIIGPSFGALEFTARALSGTISFLSGVFNFFKDVVTTDFNAVKSVVGDVWNKLSPIFDAFSNVLSKTLSPAMNTVKDVFTTAWGAIKNVVTDAWNFIKPILEPMKALLDDIVDSLKSVGLISDNAGKGGSASGAGKYLPKTGAAANGITPIGPPFTGLPPIGPPTTGGGLGGSYTTGLLPAPRDTNPWGPAPASAYMPPLAGPGGPGTSPNGFPLNAPEQSFSVNGVSAQDAAGGPAVRLQQFAQWFNDNIEPVKELAGYDAGGHGLGNQSNHTSGSALDINWSDFTALQGNGADAGTHFTPAQMQAISQQLTQMGMTWGQYWTPDSRDPGHFELGGAPYDKGAMSSLASPSLVQSAASPQDQAAQQIIAEAQKRGFTPDQIIAVLSTGMQESGLSQSAKGGGGAWHGIFQQDSSYPGRDNASTNISGFFDRLGSPQGDAWQQIFKLQQGTDYNSPGARKDYLSEIQSKQGPASELYNRITQAGTTPMGTQGDPMYIALDPTVPANQRSDKNGKGGGPNGQQLGQDFVSGIAQIFGIDGSVFPDPMSGGLFQGFKGLMSALTSGNKNGGGSYADRYGSGAAPGGGSGSLPSILQGFIPQAIGDLNPAPGTGGAPGEFMPFQPGSQPGGLLAAPMGNQPAPGGPMVQDNSVTFNGPVGNMNDANQQAINSQVPRFRQGVRPLPTP